LEEVVADPFPVVAEVPLHRHQHRNLPLEEVVADPFRVVPVVLPVQGAHPLEVEVADPFLVVPEGLAAHPLVEVEASPFLVVLAAHPFLVEREAFPCREGLVAVRVVEGAYRRSFHSTLSQYVAGITPIVDCRITIANLRALDMTSISTE